MFQKALFQNLPEFRYDAPWIFFMNTESDVKPVYLLVLFVLRSSGA
jgi:hypothetical protein